MFCKKENALRALDLAGTQATRAYVSGSVSTAGNDFNSSDVGLPSSVGLAVRVRNLQSVNNCLTAEFAFCHESAPPIYISRFNYFKTAPLIIAYMIAKINSIFKKNIVFGKFLLVKTAKKHAFLSRARSR